MKIELVAVVLLCACLFGCARAQLEPVDLEPCAVKIDAQTDAKALEMIVGRCNAAQNLDLGVYSAAYDRYTLAHRASSLHTQRWYGIIAMFFVVLLVGSGVTLTFLEFRAGNRGSSKFTFGSHGVEVDSKFLGITVLVISLAFAYLFLEKAYKIEEIGSESAQEEAQVEPENPDADPEDPDAASKEPAANPAVPPVDK